MTIPIIANKWLELGQFASGPAVSFATAAALPASYGDRHLLSAEDHITSMTLPVLSADFIQATNMADLKPWTLERRLKDNQLYALYSIITRNLSDAAPIKKKQPADLFRDNVALSCITTNKGEIAFPIAFDRMAAAFEKARHSRATLTITLDESGFDASLTLVNAHYTPIKRSVPLGTSLKNPRA